jgi:hypothetical protein
LLSLEGSESGIKTLAQLGEDVVGDHLGARQRRRPGDDFDPSFDLATLILYSGQCVIEFLLAQLLTNAQVEGRGPLLGDLVETRQQHGPLCLVDGGARLVVHLKGEFVNQVAGVAQESLDVCPDGARRPACT